MNRARLPVAIVCGLSLLLVAGCGSSGSQAPTFTQDGYTVTCQWNSTVISGQPTPIGNNEAISFCRSRAREAVGTVVTQVPGAYIQSVTIKPDGSASVCYGSGGGTCSNVLGPLPQ